MEPSLIALFVVIVVAVGIGGFFAGTRRGGGVRSAADHPPEQRLEEYGFYPFVINPDGHVEFSAEAFDEAMQHFLENRNERAARELIVIGEQNLVRETFTSDALARYKEL